MTPISTVAHDPFTTPIQGYYTTPELTQRINLIQHLIQNSEQLLFILAESGCGKTSLLNQIKAHAHENWWCHALTSSPAMSPEAFISKVLTAFNVRQEGKSWQILCDSLRSHIAATRYNNQLPILLIDDAHLLPLATLQTIVEFAMQGEPQTRMRVLLFCEPQITSILATPEFEIVQNTLVHTLDIPVLSRTQVRDYIMFYLNNTQFSTMHPFSAETIKKVYTQSGGVPRRINLIAQQILHNFAEEMPDYTLPTVAHAIDRKWIWGISGVIIITLVSLISYWQFIDPITELFKQREIVFPLPLQPSPTLTSENVPPPVTDTKETSETKDVETLTTVPTEVQPPDTNTITENVNPKPLSTNEEVKDETWLLQQDNRAYTLQVLGAYDHATLKSFLTKQTAVPNHFAIFKTDYRSKDWYVLVYGIYASRAEALAALDELPATLRQTTQPWARTLADIQTHIHKRLQLDTSE